MVEGMPLTAHLDCSVAFAANVPNVLHICQINFQALYDCIGACLLVASVKCKQLETETQLKMQLR